MAEPKDKVKFALWIYPETMEKVEKRYKPSGSKSRSEFIEKAIGFYCGYLTAEDCREYFPSVIVSSLKGMLDGFENRVASLLFKTAVELSMNLHVTAATGNVDPDTLSRLRGMCVEEVKKLHGNISFEEAYKFQKNV